MSGSKMSNQAPETPVSVEASNRWTFLTNHAHVLIALSANPDLVLREVAFRVGITERGVQRIVQELEDGGFIRREKAGRKNHYQVLTDQPLRHPIEAHRTIGDLLQLINGPSVAMARKTDRWVVEQAKLFRIALSLMKTGRSRDFRRAADLIAEAASKMDINRATLGYISMTVRCIECHSYIRKHWIELNWHSQFKIYPKKRW
jgi:predicted transcriptional regulator